MKTLSQLARFLGGSIAVVPVRRTFLLPAKFMSFTAGLSKSHCFQLGFAEVVMCIVQLSTYLETAITAGLVADGNAYVPAEIVKAFDRTQLIL